MNELALKKQNFSFLTKADINTVSALQVFMAELYENTLTNIDIYVEDFGDGTSYLLPTRYMLLNEAWGEFDFHYLDYIKNGYGGRYEDDYRDRMKSGEDGNDFLAEWDSSKYNLASYNMYVTPDKREVEYLADIDKCLALFNISYFDDKTTTDTFLRCEHIERTGWINPAIKQVW